MNLGIPEAFRGTDDLEIYKEIVGPTDYKRGAGVDYVPSFVGTGGIGIHALASGAESKLLNHPVIERVLFRIEGISDAGIAAVRNAITELEDRQMEVTHAAIMAALHTSTEQS